MRVCVCVVVEELPLELDYNKTNTNQIYIVDEALKASVG